MKARINGAWEDIPCSAQLKSDVADIKAQARALLDRLYAAESAYTTISRELVPLTATTPSRKAAISKQNMGYAPQGGCTDGTYLYIYIRQSADEQAGTLMKIRLSDYTLVKKASLSLYHGNDITYNPDDGLLYVATMYQTEGTSRVDVVDPVTLTKIKSLYVPVNVSGLAYEPTRRVFVGANSGTLAKYVLRLDDAGELVHVGSFSCSESPAMEAGLTAQNLACDGAFIYYLWTARPKMQIDIFNWMGEFMGSITKTPILYGDYNTEVEFIDKTSRSGFIMGAYVPGNAGVVPIYTFTAT